MLILNKFRQLKKSLSPHEPLIEVFIYKDNLLHNLREYQKHYPGLQFAPVLKANAYGHGLEPVLSVLKHQTPPFVCVDSHFEARLARRMAPALQVLVIGYARLESVGKSDFKKISFGIISLDQLQELSKKLKKPKRFHLKLDSGMHRQGIAADQYADARKLIESNPNIVLEGLCSHLADPENQNETLKQIENWNSAVKYFKKEFSKIKYTHLSATGGVKYSSKIDANLARLGIGFYGIDENPNVHLKPVLEMCSIIIGLKTVDAGEKIGYGFTFTASKKMKIATVPAGFFEGVDRRLSNAGHFKIGQSFCPIVGRVSMNISTIDASAVPDVQFGDAVTIISHHSQDPNSVQNIASVCGTVAYDILVRIPQHLRRTIV